jgi:hypothetical protein
MLGKDKVLCKTNYVQNKHNLYYKRIFRCIRGPAKSQMTFDLQTILVQDQTFHRLYDPKGKSKRCHIDLNKLRVKLETVKDSTLVRLPPSEDKFKQHVLRSSYQTTNYVQNKHNLYYKRIFRCIRGPAKSQMTFDFQTILVQDQTFHLCKNISICDWQDQMHYPNTQFFW